MVDLEAAIDRLLGVEGDRTLDNTLRAYDDAVAELSAVGSLTGLMHSVYPDKPVRIDDGAFIATSFPGFVPMLRELGADIS